MHWQEKGWRIPKRGEVVKDENNVKGIVTEANGILDKKMLWVNDVKGVELHSNSPAELFTIVSIEETRAFHLEMLCLKGYFPGAYCTPTTSDIPLQIVSIEHLMWNAQKIVLRDMRRYDLTTIEVNRTQVLKTSTDSVNPCAIFDQTDSTLEWKIAFQLEHHEAKGGFNVGSPMSFSTEEEARFEIKRIYCRLKARRIASVMNGDWKNETGWFVIARDHPILGYQIRLEKSIEMIGAPCYFKDALTAAIGSSYMTTEEWFLANSVSRDKPF